LRGPKVGTPGETGDPKKGGGFPKKKGGTPPLKKQGKKRWESPKILEEISPPGKKVAFWEKIKERPKVFKAAGSPQNRGKPPFREP